MSMYEEQPRQQFDRALGEPETELQATAREVLTDLGYVWLGDFSGWEIVPVVRDEAAGAPLQLELRHRCGFAQRQPDEGITGDGAAYVGNILERALHATQGHVCAPHEPSPEHQARVARWAAAAGVEPSGDVAQDQLGIVRALAKGQRPVPVRRQVDGRWQTVEIPYEEWRATDGADGRQPYRVVDNPTPVTRMSRQHYEAEFGPIDSKEHTAEIGPRVETTPAFMVPGLVPNDCGEAVPAGSLYADKCAECTTGVSCEDAGRCLFEG